MTEFIRVAVSLLPVFIFLTALIFFDSYKLVRIFAVIRTIVVGCVVASLCYFLNSHLSNVFSIELKLFTRYVAPLSEELLKAAFVFYLIKTQKVGFMVDSAIYGFAIGAGFAFVENIFYLQSLESTNILVWIIRGFGTAIMHGTTTALFGIISKNMIDRHDVEKLRYFLPGFAAAVIVHSFYNHFLLPPILITISFLVTLPLLTLIIFEHSEKTTRKWLGVGFDTDVELLEVMNSGQISETRIGKYLYSLKTRFPGEIVADMLCLLRIHLELAIRAKGILLARATGFKVTTDPGIDAKFQELKYLEQNIGKTGKSAIVPILHFNSRDLWQLHMLGK